MEWAFRRLWSLPPTDPRFLDATVDEMLADLWADHYQRRIDKGENVEDGEAYDEDFNIDEVLRLAEADWEAHHE